MTLHFVPSQQKEATTPDAVRRWFIVGLLSLGVMVAYVDRVNLSVVLALQEFKNLFHLTDSDRGTLNAAFFFSYAFLQIPAGWVVDRYGVKIPYALSFMFWGLVAAATSVSKSVPQLVGLRILLGVGESLVAPATTRWIRFHFAERERGFALGLYMMGANGGLALGAPVVAWLVSGYGWQAMFIILGLVSLLWLVPWLVIVPQDDHSKRENNDDESGQPGGRPSRALTSPVFAGLAIGTFAYNYFFYFSMTWMPAYLVERHNLSLSLMGFYQMLGFGSLAIVAPFAGWLADRLISKGAGPLRVRKGFAIAGFLMASTEVIGAMAGSTHVALFFAVFSLAGLGLATANSWVLTQTLMPGSIIGRAIGIQNFAANIAGIVAPLVTAWLKQSTGSYEASLQVIWVVLVIGIAAYVFLVRQGPASQRID